MLVTLAYCLRDQGITLKLAGWVSRFRAIHLAPPPVANRTQHRFLSSFFHFRSAVCRKTLQEVNRDPSAKSAPKNFRKKLYVM